MNSALVILERNINIVMELYKKILKSKINKIIANTP